jgi:ABC-type Fe3+/spermidine/putrescine transport system ATPase subunit
MSNGVIEQLDEPLAIYDRPATAFVADFIGDMNFFEGTVSKAGAGSYAIDADGFDVAGLGAAAVGGRVTFGLRPEKVVIVRGEAGGSANRVAATLVTKMYLGDQVQLVGELPDGRQIVAREQRAMVDAEVERLHAGDAVVASWGEDAPLLLGDVPTNRKDAP